LGKQGLHIVDDLTTETAVLVAVTPQGQTDATTKEYLDELAFLAETAGAVCVRTFEQRLTVPNPKTFIGTGKLAEVKAFVKEKCISLVIFDDELSASQIRNIETELDVKILDRTNLILDIFATRAETSYARTQVELAQSEYLLPRLTRMWTHLERQKGGIGMRGPGEAQIETDRRIMRDKIFLLKKELSLIDKQMAIQRSNRVGMVRVALVGYTNVGKSTIMNLVSKSEVFAENKLFATLDTTVRKVVIENLPFLLSDTVGFIRKLPTQLIESFKSTLDEVREADLLIHILDVSHPNFEEQYDVVNRTISEIDSTTKPHIVVFNKIDAFTLDAFGDGTHFGEDISEQADTLTDIADHWRKALKPYPCVFISATKKENIDELKEVIYQQVKDIHMVRYPYNNFLY